MTVDITEMIERAIAGFVEALEEGDFVTADRCVRAALALKILEGVEDERVP